jgi:5-methylcytosine-specific restriction endonuclease McrA
MSRTYKKPYTGSKRHDATCRNHGSCSYCAENRAQREKRQKAVADDSMEDYKDSSDEPLNQDSD